MVGAEATHDEVLEEANELRNKTDGARRGGRGLKKKTKQRRKRKMTEQMVDRGASF